MEEGGEEKEVRMEHSNCGYLSKITEIRIWKRYQHTCVHRGIIHSSRDVGAVSMSSEGQTHERMRRVHTMECYSAFKKKGIPQHTTTRVGLEDPVLSEISQSQRAHPARLHLHEVPD